MGFMGWYLFFCHTPCVSVSVCLCVCVGVFYATEIGMYWQDWVCPVTVSFSVPASRKDFLLEQNIINCLWGKFMWPCSFSVLMRWNVCECVCVFMIKYLLLNELTCYSQIDDIFRCTRTFLVCVRSYWVHSLYWSHPWRMTCLDVQIKGFFG